MERMEVDQNVGGVGVLVAASLRIVYYSLYSFLVRTTTNTARQYNLSKHLCVEMKYHNNSIVRLMFSLFSPCVLRLL